MYCCDRKEDMESILEKAGCRILFLAWQQDAHSPWACPLSSFMELLSCHSWGHRGVNPWVGFPSLALCWLLWAGPQTCQFSKAEAADSECMIWAEN